MLARGLIELFLVSCISHSSKQKRPRRAFVNKIKLSDTEEKFVAKDSLGVKFVAMDTVVRILKHTHFLPHLLCTVTLQKALPGYSCKNTAS